MLKLDAKVDRLQFAELHLHKNAVKLLLSRKQKSVATCPNALKYRVLMDAETGLITAKHLSKSTEQKHKNRYITYFKLKPGSSSSNTLGCDDNGIFGYMTISKFFDKEDPQFPENRCVLIKNDGLDNECTSVR